jgi:hypothetical protein
MTGRKGRYAGAANSLLDQGLEGLSNPFEELSNMLNLTLARTQGPRDPAYPLRIAKPRRNEKIGLEWRAWSILPCRFSSVPSPSVIPSWRTSLLRHYARKWGRLGSIFRMAAGRV